MKDTDDRESHSDEDSNMTTNNENLDSSESIQDVAENSPNDLLDMNLATDVRSQPRILDSSLFDSYLQSNEEATWVNKNAPLFDCPDKTILEIYYFHWLVLYRRLHNTPVGYVVEEFPFDVDWANEHNAISAPAALQLREGRWLRNPRYMTEYVKYWFSPGVNPRHYSFWIADAVWDVYRVHHDRSFIADVLQDLVYNYRAWEEVHRDDNGLYWQWDQNDGMEHQAGGSGYRPSINSYMYGDAVAIACMASLLGNNCLEAAYHTRAIELKSLVLSKLWNEDDKFFETMHRDATETVGIREEIGFLPWYFGLPDVDSGYEVAWAQLIDPDGFHAPYGPTTCERRHPGFTAVDTCCRWDGTSWPYATAQTLIAFANLLNEYACQQPDDGHQDGSLPVDESNYFDLLKRFTQTHYKQTPQGEIPWVGESVNPFTGEWTTSTEDYMHSSYTDLVISGLVGLRPRADNVVEVNPLVPADHWDYFALDNVQYHGHELKIVYDRDGTHYGMGQGLSIFVDGQRVAHCSDSKLRRLTANLPEPDDHQTAIHPIEDAIPPGTNVNDLTVTVSNSLGSDPGINAIKNEESTIWSGIDTGQSEDWIQVTFPETRTLRALSIEFTDVRRTTIPDRYEVQYRVSGTWKRIPEQQTIPTTPTKGTNFVVFNEITTDRVRIYCDTGDGMYYDAKASGIVSLNWHADLSGLPVTETFRDYRPDNDVK